ncbi:glycosyltransferase [Rodentibacter haemolyticus]|uniref:Glycosyltransferase n=1 Tax=Rodentibacter haemolyticus TaxID=2778911 RepID=A0ABX6V0M2_9PAST|nr:glycosyltransferase [Rodentibacter haemolyticus]QPB43158.1 glycosyltransferase [Rodentibacter haemolyticus]
MNEFSYDVVLCTYNGRGCITKQLESILNNHYLPSEIIISDDKSDDDTLEIVKHIFLGYSFTNFKILQGNGKGTKYNFLSALKYSRADYTFFSDQDDIWLPNKIEEFSKYFFISEIPNLIFSDCQVIDEKENIISHSFFEYQGLTEKCFDDDSIIFKNCVQGASSCINKPMRELILRSLEKVDIANLYMHDSWIALLAKYYGKAIFIPKPLLAYRQHNNQVGAFNKKEKIFIYLKNFKRFLYNFKLAISQRAELEKWVGFEPSPRLSSRKKRVYQYVPKLKRLLIFLFSL